MKTIEFIKTLQDKSPQNIRTEIYKKGIMSSYSDDGRMILYNSKTTRFNNDEVDELWAETNGLVIDTNNMSVLVTPPLTLRTHVNVQTINSHLSNNLYDILLVEDGTVINLYYWPPLESWRISTSRGYDMTECKWGSTSYKDIVKDILELNNTTEQEFYDSLNKNSCYTFGFKHNSMHKFLEGGEVPINRLWFIQSVSDGVVNYDFDQFGIKPQKKYTQVDSTKILFKEINNSFQNFIDDKTVLYGFILRSRDTKITGVNSNILFESSLLQRIRQLYYHSNFNEIAQQRNYDRETYIIIHSYLSNNVNRIFIELFPQYKGNFEKLDLITENIIKGITNIINTGKPSSKELILDRNVDIIYNSITNRCELTPRNRQNPRIISTYLINPMFSDVYYQLYTQ